MIALIVKYFTGEGFDVNANCL